MFKTDMPEFLNSFLSNSRLCVYDNTRDKNQPENYVFSFCLSPDRAVIQITFIPGTGISDDPVFRFSDHFSIADRIVFRSLFSGFTVLSVICRELAGAETVNTRDVVRVITTARSVYDLEKGLSALVIQEALAA